MELAFEAKSQSMLNLLTDAKCAEARLVEVTALMQKLQEAKWEKQRHISWLR